MSRKKNLSPTASLASCLDFAARVLSSTATVREICTKPVLAPMVVEAHRFGQQVMKYVEPGIPAEVRKLLRILQNKNLCRETPLAGLDVADLTWDFEGPVADTLDMELEELSHRAVMNSTDTCVVFSTSSQPSGGGQAVIWFPYEYNGTVRDEDDRKERQILLYVCPGRVKVVKSVSDLIKKMYSELPTLRENGAAYNVWAVNLGLISNNQTVIGELAITQDNDNNQCEVERILKSSSRPVDSTVATTYDASQVHATTELRNSAVLDNQGAVGSFCESPKTRNDAVTELQGTDVDSELSPVSPRSSVYLEDTDSKPYCINKSIFSFGLSQKTSTELQREVCEPVFDGGEVPERGKIVENSVKPDDVSVKEDSIATNAQGEVTLRQNKQQQALQPRRAAISTSLVDFSTAQKQQNFETEARLGLDIRLQQGFAWRSCDDKVLRRSVRSLHATKHPERGLHENTYTGHSDNCGNKQETVGIADVERNDEILDELQVDDNKSICDCINEALGCGSGEIRPSDVNIPVHEALDELCQTTEKLADNNSASFPRIEHEPQVDSSGLSVPPSENETFPPEQKINHAAVNYKDKLGARVWWELEYIARKLEHEEMIERQQQACQRQGNIQVKQGQRSTTGQFADSRKMAPAQWSRNDRTVKRKEVTIVTGQRVSGDQWISNELTIPSVVEPARNQEYNSNTCMLASSGLEKESKAPIINKAQSNDCYSADNAQMKVSLGNTLALSENQEDAIDLEVINQVEISRLSVESTKSEKQHTAVKLSAEQKFEETSQVSKECLNPAISSAGSLLTLDKSLERHPNKSYERRQHTRISISRSAERESVKSRPREFFEPQTTNTNNEEDNEDDIMAQAMWGSTRTSYERDHNTNIQASFNNYEVQTAEISAVPFNIRGRVPMRSRQVSNRVTTATDEPSTSSGTDGSPSSHSSPRSKSSIHSKETKPSIQNPSELHRTSVNLQAAPTQPPVATFIALHEDNTSEHATTSAKTRQERLNELRQKKLQKLQQTRDMSLHQQKEKQDQRNRPLSFANSVYSKASNRQLMQNALEFTLLAGGSMERERTLALQALAESTCDNFIVLLKSAKELQFRALYENHVERDSATRIFSVLPNNSSRAPQKLGNSEMISQFFKYSSAKKQFLPVPTRSFTVKTDACALVDQLVYKGKPKNSTLALARLL